jgi:hypothetical protein
MERPEGIVFLCALWFIMGGQLTLYRKSCNILNLLALLLFFNMSLFSSYLISIVCSLFGIVAETFVVDRSGRVVLT